MHLIGQLSLDMQHHGKKPQEGFELQQRVTRFCYDMLLPALERHFDEMVGKEQLLQIGRLDVDAGIVDAADNWDALLDAVVEAVKQAVAQQHTSHPDRDDAVLVQPVESGWFGKWLYWLERGYLPLAVTELQERDFWQKILESVAAHDNSTRQLRRLLGDAPVALQRLIRQHPDLFLRQLAEALTGMRYRETEQLRHPIERYFRLLHREIRFENLPFSAAGGSRPATVHPGAAAAIVDDHAQTESEKSRGKRAAKTSFHTTGQASLEKTYGTILTNRAAIDELQHALGTILQDFREKYWAIVWEWPLSGRPAPDAAAIFEVFLKKYFTGQSAALLAAWLDVSPGSSSAVAGDFAAVIKKISPVQAKGPGASGQAAASPENAAPVLEQTTLAGQTKAGFSDIENPHIPETTGRNRETTAPKETAWYVNGAGLVLLHPFLPALFGALKLTEDNTFRNLKARQTAVYLLHYLATGRFDAPEYELLMPKFLCAWPDEEPLQRPRRLSAKAKAECRHLLEAALKHWGKLGSTTPDGLQNGFLQRPGKLSHTASDGWKLQVEQSGIDILLNYLPWGIGMIKLPWMKDFLIVEWPH